MVDAIDNMLATASFGAVFATVWLTLGVVTFGFSVAVGYLIRRPRPGYWLPPIGPGYAPRWVAPRTWSPILLRAAFAAATVMFLLLPLFLLAAFAGVAGNSARQTPSTPNRW
ncbi:hypothetical protein [Williamsia herbipolensis]|uniref:hypothetical protein n=1 Tax=Williamsia herbipolensis TaxID=1603258 RepID=UPI0005F8598A|nr:hypothetical protein [Williamsia herbipolensis]